MQKNYFSLLLLVCVFLLSCEDRNTGKALSETGNSNLKISIDTVITASEINDSVTLGSIKDLVVDQNGNLFVLDDISLKVHKFDSTGAYLASYLKGEGRGPGEVIKPNAIFVDSNGFLYVTDRSERKFLVFDHFGEFINSGFLKLMPSDITAIDSSTVFVTGYRFSYQDSTIIRAYTMRNDTYEPFRNFGIRTEAGNSRLVNMSGYSDHITYSGSELYLNRYLPYHLTVYDKNLSILKQIKQQKTFFSEPYMENGMVLLEGVNREILPLKDINIIRYLDVKKSENYLDFYDKNWKYIETKKVTEYGLKNDFKFLSGNSYFNRFYLVSDKPELSIVKYELHY